MSSLFAEGLGPFAVSVFWRYRVSFQRKKCRQQIIGLDDESLSIAMCIDTKKKPVLGEMFGDAVRPGGFVTRVSSTVSWWPLLKSGEITRRDVVKYFAIQK